MPKHSSIWIGYDQKEIAAYNVARYSVTKHTTFSTAIHTLLLPDLMSRGLYKRPIDHDAQGRMWDAISNAPMATEFSLSRFFLPHVAKGWALFMDGDVLVRGNLADLFALADDQYAVMVVKHNHVPTTAYKMNGQLQTAYSRKNWSSVMLMNCDHPANRQLTLTYLNAMRGLDLHQFSWLPEKYIGELPVEWNWLVNHSPTDVDPKLVHFTDGYPLMTGRENDAYADEWMATHHEYLRPRM